MSEDENKLYKIFAARFVCIWEDSEDKNDFRTLRSVWRNYINIMGMKLTSITRDKASVFVLDPMTIYERAIKPTMYIQMDKELALKILALEYLP